jgi:hypothetical protein
MIVWTTAREVEFEKVCSSSTQSGAFYSSVGTTRNQTGSTTYFTFSNTYQQLDLTNFVYLTLTTTGSGETIFAPSGQKQTTTTAASAGNLTVFSISSLEIPQWTTSVDTQDSTIFVTTSGAGSGFFAATAGTNTQTSAVTTFDGESAYFVDHVFDTIAQAQSNEVLYTLSGSAQYSEPLTDHAITTTRATISANASAIALSYATLSNVQFIASSNSTESTTFADSESSIYSVTANQLFFAAPGSSVLRTFERPRKTEGEINYVLSEQPSLSHFGNTVTRPTITQSTVAATFSDVAGGETWEETDYSYGTTSFTTSIANIEFGTSCNGNTTESKATLGARSKIALTPSMTVFGIHGVAIGDALGFEYVGNGFVPVSDLETAEFGLAGPLIVTNGKFPNVATILPITTEDDRGVTQNGASITFSSTTQTTTQSEPTTVSAVVAVIGQAWSQPARIRANLLGGNLGQSETAQIAIKRGLYKNQEGQTSWFDGSYESWTGTKETTYWYPISYLEPAFQNNFLNFPVWTAPRNETTWPSFSNMP